MARPIWKGNISFGLVNIPVTLFSGEQRSELSFRMLDSRNMARVRYSRVNDVSGEEVPWNDVVKAYEYGKDDYVLLDEEDFEKAAVEATQTVEIEDFVDRNAVDYMYYDKPYVLVPGKKAEKGYVLLRETLKKTGRIGIARVVLRTKQYLSAVIPQDAALLLEIMRFHDEIRALDEFDLPEGKPEDYKVSPKELQMAATLVESMTSEWTPAKYRDEYREALMDWIEKKHAAGRGVEPPTPEKPEPKPKAGELVDFMDILKKSVEQKEKERKSSEKKGGRGSSKGGRKKASGG